MRRYTRYFFLLIPAMVIFLSACLPEKKLGREFIELQEKIRLQVLPPAYILKFNHKGEKIKGFKKLTEDQQDSALYASSQIVQHVDDSVYLERYVNSFLEECRKLGFEVYLDSDEFLKDTRQAYVLNMVQLQLDEYFFPHQDSQTIGDTVYTKSFELNAVDGSTWFELSKVNNSSKKTVLYSSMTASDAFEGNFYVEPFGLSVHYRYNIDSLVVRDIYDLASYSGKRQAGYLFDFFLNNYITLKMGRQSPMGYLHYDRSNRSLYFTEDEGFEILSQ